MKNEDITKNESTEEVFSEEELSKINETLKVNENIELPESLSKENIKELLQKEVNKLEVLEKETENLKKENKSLFKKMIAVAAIFAVVVTSVFVMRNNNFVIGGMHSAQRPDNQGNEITVVEDYSEIENMFLGYQKNYQKIQKFSYATDIFGGIGATKDEAVMENGAVPGATSPSPESNINDTMTGGGELKGEISSSDNSLRGDHGETNEQVKGVNEADIIKNDGKYLYVVPAQKTYWEYQSFLQYGNKLETTTSASDDVASDVVYTPGYNPNEELYKNMTEEDFINKIFIVKTGEKGALIEKSAIKVGKHENEKIKYSEVTEIFVDNNRLVAILDCYSFYGEEKSERENGRYFYYDYKMITCAVSFDISDRSNPKEEWRVYQDGDYLSARKVGNKVVLISNYNVPLYIDDVKITDYCVPEVYCGENACRIPSDDICVMSEVRDSSYVVVSTLDVTNHKETFNSTAVLGGGENVYCTTENLYVTSGRYEETVSSKTSAVAEIFMIDDSAIYTTEILKFDISNDKIEYKTKGKVNGTALNQFSVDEYNGYLRIATTTGNFQDAKNNLYVLDADMVIVGMVEGLAKGETIKSVRFMGDTGYVVTFEQTDPLFVIDLKDPENPEVLGELKIPGFSNYLHPVTENYLLGIGVNGDDSGAGDGMKVSLFDVSDNKNPKEVAKFEILPQENTDNLWGYLESVAFYDHNAVCWDSKNLTMYIPYRMTTEYMHTED
ncbi:MAG: beta-propeller domain-containing protein, partial [Clostridia bacterium]|nr:beta-propeller domain-containing protein [Clostridia bacterium]